MLRLGIMCDEAWAGDITYDCGQNPGDEASGSGDGKCHLLFFLSGTRVCKVVLLTSIVWRTDGWTRCD